MEGIQTKIPEAREKNFVLYLLNPEGLRLLVDAEVLDHAANGQDFLLELGMEPRGSRSFSQPDSGFYSSIEQETPERQAMYDYFDFESFDGEMSPAALRTLVNGESSVTSTSGTGSLDSSAELLYCPEVLIDSKSGARRTTAAEDSGQFSTRLPLLRSQSSWDRMMCDEPEVKVETSDASKKLPRDHGNARIGHSEFIRKSKQIKQDAKNETAHKRKPKKPSPEDKPPPTGKPGRSTKKKGKSLKVAPTTAQVETERQIVLDKNREAASRCRARRKESMSAQCNELEAKKNDNMMLQNTLAQLRMEAQIMTQMLAEHKANCFETDETNEYC